MDCIFQLDDFAESPAVHMQEDADPASDSLSDADSMDGEAVRTAQRLAAETR